MKKNRDLTEGNILKNLILFALPMILGNLLQQVYNIGDTIIVGQFIGSDALASVGSSYTLMTFLTSIIIGLCMGSGALFSKAFGAKQTKQMKEDIRLSFIFIGCITALLYFICIPNTDTILHLLKVPFDVYDLMKSYIQIIFWGLGFVFLYNFFAFLLRGIGNSLVPLYCLTVSSLLNIVLDIIAVIVFRAGVAGTAVATIISQAVSSLGLLIYVLVKHADLLKLDEPLHWNRMVEIVQNDIFTGLQQSVMNLGILMIQGLVNSFGSTIMAAFAAAVKIDTLAYMPAQEFGNAYSLFISQNYGAKKAERIRQGTKLAMVLSFVFCLSVSGIIWLFAADFMKVFVKAEETEILLAGVRYLRIEGTFYFGIGILFLFYGYYRGIQRAEMSLVLTVISLGTRVLLSYLLAPNTSLGVLAIWWSIPIGWILADLAGLFFYKRIRVEL